MLQTSISQSSQQTKSILPRHLEFRTNITQLKPLWKEYPLVVQGRITVLDISPYRRYLKQYIRLSVILKLLTRNNLLLVTNYKFSL
jgi:hypothetical protein